MNSCYLTNESYICFGRDELFISLYYIMKVKIVDTRRENKKERHGWKADFVVDNAPSNTVIYQNVTVKIKSSDGEKDKYSFTEAWPYDPTRKVTDSFLVPLGWRKGLSGRIKVIAITWARTGPMDSSLKTGVGDDYWGNLHGSFDLLRPTFPTTKRKVVITWANEGKRSATHYTKGKDLTLERNQITY